MSNSKNHEALEKISKDRTRSNILKQCEQAFIAFLVQRIPQWMTSNMLTGIGFIGSLVVVLSFILAEYVHHYWLLLNMLGFAINWFGDSLDGRLAYYRNKPRKWYGFSLDFIIDWFSIVSIGIGYIIYVGASYKVIGFVFVFLYGWSMMMALLRYKIADKYIIDSGIFGPTELRIIISLIISLEALLVDSIIYSGILICIVLLTINIIDFVKLLGMADVRDIEERKTKEEGE
jgi:phosphatidylglycerophosphate synthase